MPHFVDKAGKTLRARDKVKCRLEDGFWHDGIILYHKENEQYMVLFKYSMWYGEDKFDYHSYGKGYVLKDIKPDDLELIESYIGGR
jgi:hypothetical protein